MTEPVYTVTNHHGPDVLPWFASPQSERLPHGTRLFTFRDYHTAPVGTRIRRGRKGGVGQVFVKIDDAFWPEGTDTSWRRGAGLTAYGLERLPSYVEWPPEELGRPEFQKP